MTRKTDSISGITFGFDDNVSNWGDLVNLNFQILAYQDRPVALKGIATNTPPSSPSERDSYVVGNAPTGLWSGFAEHNLAIYGYDPTGTTLAWLNVTPIQGFTALDVTSKRLLTYIDATEGWISAGLSASQISSIGNILTIDQIVTDLNARTGNDRVDYSAIKNTPTPLSAEQLQKIRDAITSIRVGSDMSGDGVNSDLNPANPFTDADETKLDALDVARQIPTGGSIGEVVTRTSTGVAWQPVQTTGNTFAGIFSNSNQFSGSGVDADNELTLLYPFTTEEKTKLAGIATGAQVNRSFADTATGLNALPAGSRVSYNSLDDTPTPGTTGDDTPNERITEINKATNQIEAARVSGLPSGVVSTQTPVTGDSVNTPVTLDADSKTKLGKLKTDQPEFLPINYQADLTPGANIPSTSYNYIKGIEAFKRSLTVGTGTFAGITVNTDQFTGTGVDASTRLALRYPFTQAEKNKLGTIESGATADQTIEEIATGLNNPSNSSAQKIDYDQLKNKPTSLSADTPNHRIEEINKATNQILAARISGLPTAVTETSITIRNKLETLVGNSRFDGDYVLGLLKEPAIVELIVAVAGTRVDDIIQTIINLVLDHTEVTGDTINFNDQTDILKSVNNVEAFAAGKYSLLEIADGNGTDYDAIIVDNDFILAKTEKTPPVEFRYVNDTTRGFGDNYSQEFVLLRDGAPVRVSGSSDNDPQYHTIRVGRSRNNSPLVAKIYPETALTLTIKVATLRTQPTTSGVTTLGALTDVDTAGAVNNNVLTYDDNDDTWKPKTSTSATVPENRKIPDGGSSGQVLTKADGTDYNVDWETPSTVPTNQRIPRGGDSGQVITKTGSGNYAVSWRDVPSVPTNQRIPTGGTTGQVITKTGSGNYATGWRDVPNELPAGGTAGQVLKKKTNNDRDVEWDDETSGGAGLNQTQVDARIVAKVENYAEVDQDKTRKNQKHHASLSGSC